MRDNLINIFLDKNSQINLSAIRDRDWVMIKHIQDSIELNKIFKLRKWAKVCDIWTWGWFPLLPLAMTNLDTQFIWIDARRKKTEAVNDIIKQLKLKNAKCIWSRVEELWNKNIQWWKYSWYFDYITARAIGYSDKIIEWSYKLLKNWWYFILYKEFKSSEKQDLKKICNKKNLKIEKISEYSLFEWDINRIIYVIKKI